VKVHDCIIFAADSASSLVGVDASGKPEVLNVWAHGNKVFNLFKGKPIAAMTCGMGHMGAASIGNLAKDFRRQITKGIGGPAIDPENYTIEEVVGRAKQFYEERYATINPPPPNPHSFEFWVGGYDAGADNGEIWKIRLADGTWDDPARIASKDEDGQIAWGGQPKPIQRVIMGFDAELGDALKAAGLPEPTIQPLLQQVAQRLLTPLVHAAMPVQDAIALADFAVDLTKRYFAFLPGADIVGGDTDIATVTKHEGFKWVRRKHYYPVELNPRETDHV
jgi:hypothetical protein